MKKILSLVLFVLISMITLSTNHIFAANTVLYSEDFDGGGTGDGTLGSLTIENGMALLQSPSYSDIYIPVDITGEPNLEYQYDFTYAPDKNVYRYVGVKFWGINGTVGAFDSSLGIYLVEDEARNFYLRIDFNDGNSWVQIYNNQAEKGGLYPGSLNLVDGQTARIKITLFENELTVMINGTPVFQNTLLEMGISRGEIFGSNFVGEDNNAGLYIDNIIVSIPTQSPDIKVYQENFNQAKTENFTDKENMVVEDGKLKSLQRFSRVTFPVVNEKPQDWTITMNVTYTSNELEPATDPAYFGINVFDAVPGVTYEFTTELASNGMGYALIKGAGGNVVAHTGNEEKGPSFAVDQTFEFKLHKFASRVKLYVDGVEYLSYEDLNFGTPSGFAIYTFSQYQVTVDDVVIEISEVLPKDDILFSFNFNDLDEGDLWTEQNPETAFVVTADKWIESATTLSQAYPSIDAELFTTNWTLSYDILYPTGVEGFFGFNLLGIDGNSYEFTLQNTLDNPDYFLIKKNGGEYAHSNGGNGIQNPVLKDDARNHVRVESNNGVVKAYVNGKLVVQVEIPNATAPQGLDFFSYGAVGVKIDNIKFRENDFDLPLTSVELIPSRLSFSTLQSSVLSTKLNPSSASITEIKWFMNDTLLENATGRTYTFTSNTTGTFNFYVEIDGIKSNEVTITVTEPSETELNSIYYENFDAMSDGASYGNFVVQNGYIHTAGQVYGNKFFDFTPVANWEMSMDVTFRGETTANTYFGINIQGLVNPASREFEFNLMRVATNESSKDKVIIKDSGVETTFNDSENHGRLENFAIEDGVTYHFRVVRWEDQLEIWIDDEIAIKTLYQDPAVATRLFIYWYNANGAQIEVDNIVYAQSEEPEEILLPPHVDVTSAYITSNRVTANVGQEVTLTLMTEPSYATPIDIKWYVNDTLIPDATSKTYTFISTEAGTYVFKVIVDGITSDTRTITINQSTTPTDPGSDPSDEATNDWMVPVIISVSVLAVGGLGVGGFFWFKKRRIVK